MKESEMTAVNAIEIIKLLEQNGIEVYVDGGWCVDALLGEQTRKHDDLDIVLPHKFVPKLREIFESLGYKDIPRDDLKKRKAAHTARYSDGNFVLDDDFKNARPRAPRDTRDCNFVLGDDKGNLLDVHSYTFDENGNHIFGVAYKPHHFTGTGVINGYTVKCIPPDIMVGFHTGYIDETAYLDVKALCERFNIPLPSIYEKFEKVSS